MLLLSSHKLQRLSLVSIVVLHMTDKLGAQSQVNGAAEASLSAAAATVRTKLQAAVPAPEKATLEVPSLQLTGDVLELARRLAFVAAQSIARCGLSNAELPSLQVGSHSTTRVAEASV